MESFFFEGGGRGWGRVGVGKRSLKENRSIAIEVRGLHVCSWICELIYYEP